MHVCQQLWSWKRVKFLLCRWRTWKTVRFHSYCVYVSPLNAASGSMGITSLSKWAAANPNPNKASSRPSLAPLSLVSTPELAPGLTGVICQSEGAGPERSWSPVCTYAWSLSALRVLFDLKASHTLVLFQLWISLCSLVVAFLQKDVIFGGEICVFERLLFVLKSQASSRCFLYGLCSPYGQVL